MPAQPTSISHMNFEAWVECDGKALPVYDVEVNGTKATCWIASQAGKTFSAHFKIINRSERGNYSGRVYVDGSRISGRVFGTIPPYNRSKRFIDAMHPTPTTEQKLRFSSLETSDDDNAVKDNAILSHIGTIEVRIVQVQVNGTVEHGIKAVPTHLDSQQKFTVHEAAKKLGGHHAQLAAPKVVKPMKSTDVRDVGGPIVELQFRYRPQAVLEAQDIIPRSRATDLSLAQDPSRKRARQPNDAGRRDKKAKTTAKSEHADSDGALRARIRELEAQLDVKVKAEAIQVSGEFGPGQIIDLTDD
ncbi:hypothetical protein EXIGLDRAFT_726315 [Exidia glandulosa HHB12029]|uniref:DUF7918 domain-containing protein n=1 Tax=Exidia glandulosa HHB12029 TaxID=1314781 RepID=A0A165DSZ7_EXIGL|nr:hypothetical protein EXIGLDRAFT_726315 [Exidia glandulosa HHB12029]